MARKLAALTAMLVMAVATPCVAQQALAPALGASVAATPEALARHVLSRLSFGPRAGDVERVLRMGVDRWIEQQLSPQGLLDSAAALALIGCNLWTLPVGQAVSAYAGPSAYPLSATVMVAGQPVVISVTPNQYLLISGDSIRRLGESAAKRYVATRQLAAGRLTRAEFSDQQLVEVLTDFWENHFSVYGAKLPMGAALIEWDRSVIRPNVLGRFRDLLGAVAHSPAMLAYLDNALSGADSTRPTLAEVARRATTGPDTGRLRVPGGLNENYGRELLELHTLGVDGGYTQNDVIEVARALTGWTHSWAVPASARASTATPGHILLSGNGRSVPLMFWFDSARHDAGAKQVLGRSLPAGRGLEDGEEVLDLLARHPSTARHIARKLAVRFVSDDPPASLVERAATEYLRTDGDIRAVMRVIVMSPEFRSPDVFAAKVKTPTELVLSLRRAMSAPVDTDAELIDLLLALRQAPFGYLSPEGWPETAGPWISAGSMLTRVAMADRVARGDVRSIPVERWPGWSTLSTESFDQQLDGVVRLIFDGQISTATRAALAGARPTGRDAIPVDARPQALRELIARALSAPEFQRR